MRRTAAPLLLAASLLAAAGAAAHAAEKRAAPASPTGLARFTNHSRMVSAKISPKGTYLAAVTMQGGRPALLFVNLATRALVSTFNPSGATTVGRFYWINDERVIIELVDLDGTLAGPVTRGELLAVNARDGGQRFLFGYRTGGGRGSRTRGAEPEAAWGRVVDTLRHDDRYVLIASRSMQEAGDRQVRLWRLDTVTGAREQVAISPIPEASFFTDEEGELRLAAGWDTEFNPRYFLREGKLDWRELTQLKGFSKASDPVAYIAKDQAIEVVEPLGTGFGLFSVSVETGERKLLARTEVAPPGCYDRDKDTLRTVALESAPDLPVYDILDAQHPIARLVDGLLAAYPGQHVRILGRTEDDRLAVAHVYGDRNPGEFLLVDVARHSAEPLGSTRPWIAPEEMAEMEAFHIAASDGLRIHGYLTLPRGLAAGAKPPLVVLPHGGPHGVRDHWGFDWEVQLLASRGFAVLQVNYRGSGGYGDAYQEAGYRRWGDRVVQDVVDATRWAIRKGKVDGARVCAVGASFGAYAAMQASILAPDLFRCAAGIAGIYDLTTMGSEGDISWSGIGRGYVKKAVGDDEAKLRAASPVYNAAKLGVPVFLAHGGRDDRAPIEHAEKLKEALTALGRPPGWLVERTEGHGFFDEAARLRLYTRLVDFLEAHTGPTAGAMPAPGAATPALKP